MAPTTTAARRVGIVGYGHIGQYLYEAILKCDSLELDFVWNRSIEKLAGVPKQCILEDLKQFNERNVDLIVEISHVSITKEFGQAFLKHCDFMVGSPTALADSALEAKLRHTSMESGHTLYVPAGAFWGGDDISKMADLGSLKALKVTMKKHPSSFKLLGELAEKNNNVGDAPCTLYDGPVRELCPLAPFNVNTMACAAIAAHNLGFDNVQGCLIADKSLNCHIVEIEVTGPGTRNDQFTVKTVRTNPCKAGAVTGNATYDSFFASLKSPRSTFDNIYKWATTSCIDILKNNATSLTKLDQRQLGYFSWIVIHEVLTYK